MNNTEERIRELAYEIWETEGRPDGQDARHWEMATRLLQSEQQGDLQPLPSKKSPTRKPRSKAAAPANDETQMEKPALLGKPAGADKPAKAKRAPVVRTSKVSEASKPDTNSRE